MVASKATPREPASLRNWKWETAQPFYLDVIPDSRWRGFRECKVGVVHQLPPSRSRPSAATTPTGSGGGHSAREPGSLGMG
jgi:hypothetical protein